MVIAFYFWCSQRTLMDILLNASRWQWLCSVYSPLFFEAQKVKMGLKLRLSPCCSLFPRGNSRKYPHVRDGATWKLDQNGDWDSSFNGVNLNTKKNIHIKTAVLNMRILEVILTENEMDGAGMPAQIWAREAQHRKRDRKELRWRYTKIQLAHEIWFGFCFW